jgi:hypothetical protein
MTRLIILIFGLFVGHVSLGNSIVKLKVLEIRELKDCYILTTISDNSDTLYLISIKDSLNKSERRYHKISVGKKFVFVIMDRNESLSIPDENFRLRVRNTVVWRGDEDFKKYPSVIENAKGLYIIKKQIK